MKLLTLFVVLLITGCATAGIVEPGASGYRWTTDTTILTPQIQSVTGTFFSVACPTNKECTPATLSTTLPGEEAYSYVFKVKIRAVVGIPYGEQPAQIYVIGDHSHCMEVSERHNHRPNGEINEGTLRLSADPTERCVGPVFIR